MGPDTLQHVIQRTSHASTVEELGTYFLTFAKDLGFDAASYHILKQGLHQRTNADIPLLHSFPEDWVDFYISKKCIKFDPIIAQAQRERKPFHWFRVDEMRTLTDAEKHYLSLVRDTGMTDGLAVPLYGPGGEVAFAALGLRNGRIDLSPEQTQMLQYCLYEIYNSCQIMHDHTREPPVSLTPREQEILLWVAKGKSNSVIAEILKISEHTVDSLLRRVFRKLEVGSRLAAVIKAVQWGLINP